jgi:hypothetical protein
LKENAGARNNSQGQESCPWSPDSIDKLSNALSPQYQEFQSKYVTELLPNRFDTNNYSTEKFKALADNPRVESVYYGRISIDEA